MKDGTSMSDLNMKSSGSNVASITPRCLNIRQAARFYDIGTYPNDRWFLMIIHGAGDFISCVRGAPDEAPKQLQTVISKPSTKIF